MRRAVGLGALVVVLGSGPATAQVTQLPESRCLAAKIGCITSYVGAVGKCDARAAKTGGPIDPACAARAAAKLANAELKGCLDKAARRSDCVVAGPQDAALKPAADAFLETVLCELDPTNASCGTLWYLDDDADGHGDAAVSVQAPAPPAGYV